MKTNLLSSIIALASLLLLTPAAQAYDPTWCSTHYNQPECNGGGGPAHSVGVNWVRLVNPCNVKDINGAYVDVEVTMPYDTSPGRKRPAVLLLHGGGVDGGHRDWHSPAHPVNPYQELARQLALMSMVVIQPIMPVGPASTPYGDADTATAIVSCFARKTDKTWCPSKEPCLSGNVLYDALSLTITKMDSLLVVGHSSGGVSALYMPQKLNGTNNPSFALRGLILIDPAKEQYTLSPPQSIAAATPVVHLYPDYYGPLRNSNNNLFRLGAPNSCVGGTSNGLGCVDGTDCPGGSCTGVAPIKGSWVPIGIRDSPAALASSKHDAQHCLGLEGTASWVYNPPADHFPYCYPAQWSGGYYCSKLPPNGGTCGGANFCGQDAVCYSNPNLKTGTGNLAWGSGTARQILHRYVSSYAACLSADYGSYYQPWVTGSDRATDDSGSATSFCEDGMPPFGAGGGGNPNPTCSLNTNTLDCWTAGCHWVQAEGYKTIRVNNGQVVTDYTQNTDRWYTAYERYNTPSAGAFTERTEKNSGTPTDPLYVKCQAGIANF